MKININKYHIPLLILMLSLFFSCRNEYRRQPLYEIEENGLYGFVDTLGNKVVVPQFLAVAPFHDNLALVLVDTLFKESNGIDEEGRKGKHYYLYMKYGYINSEGKFVIQPNLTRRAIIDNGLPVDKNALQEFIQQRNFSFSEGRAAYLDTVNDKYGFIDTLGNVCVKASFHDVKGFGFGLAPVCKLEDQKSLWGYIDKQGKLVTDFAYLELSEIINGYATGRMPVKVVEDEDSVMNVLLEDTIIDENGNEIIGYKAEKVKRGDQERFHIITVLLDSKARILRKDLNSNYRYYSFSKDEGIAVAQLVWINSMFEQSRFLLVNTAGGVSDGPMITDVTWMKNGFSGITYDPEGKEWFFIDKNLRIQQPINGWDYYEHILPFNYGLAAIKHDGQWGYVNSKFQIVIPLKYDSCEIADKYLNKVYQKIDGTNFLLTSWINRRDSIIWQSSSQDSINNMYSHKPSELYGKWYYESNDNNLVIIIVGSIFLFVVIFCMVLKKRRKYQANK